MAWTPKETDRLLVFAAAELARRRRARGLLLNHPEVMALLTDEIYEGARAGLSYDAVVRHARDVLRPTEVLPGVAALVRVVQVDAMFPDGTRLVTVHDPLGVEGP